MDNFTEETVDLACDIQAVCNKHMLKYKSIDAEIQTIWALADLLGIHIALSDPPEGIIEDILNYIRRRSEIDPSKIPTRVVNRDFQ
jgi:hypothetical protein